MMWKPRNRVLVCLALVSGALAAACSKSPAQPSVSISAPTPMTPTNGVQLNFSGQPVVLVVQNATVSGSGAVTYTF